MPTDSVKPWKECPQRRDNGQCECDDQPCPGNDCEFASAHWRGVDDAVAERTQRIGEKIHGGDWFLSVVADIVREDTNGK